MLKATAIFTGALVLVSLAGCEAVAEETSFRLRNQTQEAVDVMVSIRDTEGNSIFEDELELTSNAWRRMLPPGSRSLNVTATWGPLTPATPGYLNVYYEAPLAGGGFSSGTVDVRNGVTASINVTDKTVDLPHTVQTRWRLWVSLAATAPGPYTVDIEADAIRKPGALEPAPTHPDHWANAMQLLLNEYEGPYGELFDQDGVPGFGEHPGWNFSPEEGKIVPPLTEEVVVTVHLNVSTPSETAPEPLLNWRGADRRDNEVAGMPPSDSEVQGEWHMWQWIIQPEPHMWDSPYAVESNWGIFIDWSGGLGPASPTATQGDVSIRVDARR